MILLCTSGTGSLGGCFNQFPPEFKPNLNPTFPVASMGAVSPVMLPFWFTQLKATCSYQVVI